MQRIIRRHNSVTGLVVVIFIVLVSAVGYTYVLTYRAQVASAPEQQSTAIAAESTAVPTIEQPSDLDDALAALDAASVDNLSDAELQALEADLNNL